MASRSRGKGGHRRHAHPHKRPESRKARREEEILGEIAARRGYGDDKHVVEQDDEEEAA